MLKFDVDVFGALGFFVFKVVLTCNKVFKRAVYLLSKVGNGGTSTPFFIAFNEIVKNMLASPFTTLTPKSMLKEKSKHIFIIFSDGDKMCLFYFLADFSDFNGNLVKFTEKHAEAHSQKHFKGMSQKLYISDKK